VVRRPCLVGKASIIMIKDSTLTFDLVNSEQVDRIIAQTFVDVLNRGTEYATFFSGYSK
jgi:hypothetical protein